MKLINVTPHAITVVGEDGASVMLAPSGVVARVATTRTDEVRAGFRFTSTVFGAVEGLPCPEEGTVFVASTLVAQAAKRPDVVSPDTGPTAVRENGQVVAVKGFQVFA